MNDISREVKKKMRYIACQYQTKRFQSRLRLSVVQNVSIFIIASCAGEAAKQWLFLILFVSVCVCGWVTVCVHTTMKKILIRNWY